MTHMTQNDAPFIEGAIACARMGARVCGLSWEMRHGASCVTPEATHHRAAPARFPRVHPSRSSTAVMRRWSAVPILGSSIFRTVFGDIQNGRALFPGEEAPYLFLPRVSLVSCFLLRCDELAFECSVRPLAEISQ
jgi:hypothetical protein